ncbi:UxaA family hydrolase [Burkholderia sp. Bp8984]|uniref:UxaA family hydrolase n=1 Tax=Burkholderia sp. Bp8984 TaxID=2184549 RepID=UPI0021AB7E2F|nr:UxaA family hydrolase [Burkholderia sp. Bp8984]
MPASRLTAGLRWGGPTASRGRPRNSALGAAVDLLKRIGGTALLSETPEIHGAEHRLIARAASRDEAGRLVDRFQVGALRRRQRRRKERQPFSSLRDSSTA